MRNITKNMEKIDKSFEAFKIFKDNINDFLTENINESDTRSKLIDNILINVLNWSEKDIKREGKVDSGYYDYIVSIPGFLFVIEAKKIKNSFNLPQNHTKARVKSLLKNNSEIFSQIREYADDSGIKYGIITNGEQFVIIKLFNDDGISWKENNCLIFNGFTDIENRFVEFYNNFSKDSIVENGGFTYDLPQNETISYSIFSKLNDRDKPLFRNPLTSNLRRIIDDFFGEMFSYENESNEKFIEECFVENKETKKNKSDIEKQFADVAPKLDNVIPAFNTENIKKQIRNEINLDVINLKDSKPPKPIIIIGSKGAGKSSFINHLFKYQNKEKEFENHFVIYLDLIEYFNNVESFDIQLICEDILEKIYEKHEEIDLHSYKTLRRIYNTEINRNDRGIWLFDKEKNIDIYEQKISEFFTNAQSNSSKHLEKINHYFIRERRKRLIIIIDNADQFDEKIQSQAYIFSNTLSQKHLCGTVISLREGYYYKYRFSKPFDAYVNNNIYHITAPKYSEVLQKRIDYVLANYSFNNEEIEVIDKGGHILKFNSQAVYEFFFSLKNSIFVENNNSIIDFLNQTTYPNIREGLNIFKIFLTSGHTKVEEYIVRERYRVENEITPSIPFHEFIKSIGLINKHYYSSKNSSIHNILLPNENSTDHFVNFYILKQLSNLYDKEGNIDKYVSLNDMIEMFSSLGYRANTIVDSIKKMINLSLVDTDSNLSDVDKKEFIVEQIKLCITLKGYYYVKELITRFHYIDLILQDTPIYDESYFNDIFNLFPLSDESGKRNLNQRLNCVNKFIEYIKFVESNQPNRIILQFGSFYEHIKLNLEKDISRLKNSMNK